MAFPSQKDLLLDFPNTKCILVRESEQVLLLTWLECVLLRMVSLKDMAPGPQGTPKSQRETSSSSGSTWWPLLGTGNSWRPLTLAAGMPLCETGVEREVPRENFLPIQDPGVVHKELCELFLGFYKAQGRPWWHMGYYLTNEVLASKIFKNQGCMWGEKNKSVGDRCWSWGVSNWPTPRFAERPKAVTTLHQMS